MRKGLLGVERLNQILQYYLNPPSHEKKEKEVGGGLLRQGDKVMQVKNNYQLEWEVRGKDVYKRQLLYWPVCSEIFVTAKRRRNVTA